MVSEGIGGTAETAIVLSTLVYLERSPEVVPAPIQASTPAELQVGTAGGFTCFWVGQGPLECFPSWYAVETPLSLLPQTRRGENRSL